PGAQVLQEVEAVLLAQEQIEHDASPALGVECREELARGGEAFRVDPGGREERVHGLLQGGVVVDDEDGRLGGGHVPSGAGPSASASGSAKQIRVTSGETFRSAQRRPPCAAAIDRQIASPIPNPSVFVVKNGSKIRSAIPSRMPLPLS